MRSEREAKLSDVNKPVIGLRPLKERNKRSEAMIEEQVDEFKKNTQMFLIGMEGNFYTYIMCGSTFCVVLRAGFLGRSLSIELPSLVHLSHCACNCT